MFTSVEGSEVKPRGRRVVVVDVENVIGGAVLDTVAAAWAREHVLRALGGTTAADQVVVGVSRRGLIATGCAWSNLRYVVGSGLDGADRALLEVLDEGLPARFAEVVVVSGDGIFAPKVAELAAAGMHVTVVAHPEKLANRLRLAAHQVTHLTERCCPANFGDVA